MGLLWAKSSAKCRALYLPFLYSVPLNIIGICAAHPDENKPPSRILKGKQSKESWKQWTRCN